MPLNVRIGGFFMLDKIFRGIRTSLERLYKSVIRFPESLALITTAMIILILMNHNEFKFTDDVQRLVFTLVLGFFTFLSFRALISCGYLKRLSIKLIVMATLAVWLIVYYVYLFPEFSPVSVIRYIAITLASALIYLIIPFVKRKGGFEGFINRLLSSFFITYLYAFVLFIGVAAIIFTIDQLFAAKINSKVYLDIFIIVAGIFSPAYFLSGVPEREEDYDYSDYTRPIKVLLFYIVMPILAIYTLILYVYFAKVLITATWPQGMVSNLVIWYAIITAGVIFLTEPIKAHNMWSSKFVKFMPISIIPLLGMCFLAIGIRIQAYGITESRYYVVVTALWLLGVMLYWIFKKEHRNMYLAASFAIIAILTVFGPQSSFSISFNSQTSRLEGLLVKNNMLMDGKLIKASNNISDEDKNNISSIMRYLSNEHKNEKVVFLPEDFSIRDSEKFLGFDINNYQFRERNFYSFYTKGGLPIDISGYKYYVPVSKGGWSGGTANIGDLSFEYQIDSQVFKISKDKKLLYSKNINDFADILIKEYGRSESAMEPGNMTFEDTQGNIQVKFIFNVIDVQESVSGDRKMTFADFAVLIKE